MKYIHHIYLSVFAKEEENKEAIIEAFSRFIPETTEKEKIAIEEETVTIDSITKMKVFRIKISKDKYTKKAIEILKEFLSEEDRLKILEQKNRVDEEGNLYLRFNKMKLIENEELVLTDGGDCFHMKIQIAAYPKTKAKAEAVVETLFKK